MLRRREWLALGAGVWMTAATGCGEREARSAGTGRDAAGGTTEKPGGGGKWRAATAEEVGMDAAKLNAWSEWLGGNGCVVRQGRMVHRWGAATAVTNIWSASKAIYGYLLVRAVEQGRLASLDEAVVEVEPRLAGLNLELGEKDRKMTWRHLLQQVSGYGLEEAPGVAFAYNDYAMTLLWETLVYQIYQVPVGQEDAVLATELGRPLGFEKRATFGEVGTANFGLISLSMVDLARVGQLGLQGGRWQDAAVVSAQAWKEITSSPLAASVPRTAGREAAMIPGARTFGAGKNQDDHCGSYSHAWWVNGVDSLGQRLWPGVPEDAYGAFGHGGKFSLVVLPQQELTVAWAKVRFEVQLPMAGAGRVNLNEGLGKLLESIRE